MMERTGHYGVTLVLGAGAVLLLGVPYGILSVAVMLLVEDLPDTDQVVEVWEHRGWTHSFAFALLVAFIIASSSAFPAYIVQQAATEYGIISPIILLPINIWLFIGGSVTASVSGHVVADTLTKGGGFKAKPF